MFFTKENSVSLKYSSAQASSKRIPEGVGDLGR